MPMTIDDIMRAAPVIPVLVLDGEQDWARLAETFVAAALPVLEVTLRTRGALDAIARMSKVAGAIVGAGTVLNQQQLSDALGAGAQFVVSPGLSEPLARAVERAGVAYLPGVATAGDIMRGRALGRQRFKFFPADAPGGAGGLSAVSGPFAKVRFCPTGGIRPGNAAEWLALDTVLCVGGTWLYRHGDTMEAVAERARAAAALRT